VSDSNHPTSTTAPLYFSGDKIMAEVDAARTEVAIAVVVGNKQKHFSNDYRHSAEVNI
jgi:hypothetical protein